MRRVAATAFVLAGLLVASAPAAAKYENRVLRRALAACPDLNGGLIYTGAKWDALSCALPLLRPRGSMRSDDLLAEAAAARSRRMMRCGARRCGRGPRREAQRAGYFSDPGCDAVAQVYQRFTPETSARKMLQKLFADRHRSRLLRDKRWREYGLALVDHGTGRKAYQYLTVLLGRRCADTYPAAPQPSLAVDAIPPVEDDLLHEKHNGTFKYHVVYVWAKDRSSRFGLFRNQINADVLEAAALPLPPGEQQRSLRFDIGTAQDPSAVDITGQQVPLTYEELSQAEFGPLEHFFGSAWGWDRAHLGRHKNLLIYVDAQRSDAMGSCGAATTGWSRSRDPLVNWGNNQFQVAKIYLADSSLQSFCGARMVQHEIGHNLGALGPEAPNVFDGSHCDDAEEDPMCYPGWTDQAGIEHSTPGRIERHGEQANHGAFWDFGHDDYWDPVGGTLPWWTTNLSRFVCPDAACTPDSSDLIGF